VIGKGWVLIRNMVLGFIEHEDLSRGAAIAYYTIFSIAPLLIIVIAIAGLVFGHDAAQGAIVAQLRGLIGKQSAEILQSMIQSASQKTTGVLATVIGVGTLLVTSTGAFAEIQSALNAIWKASPSVGFSALIRSRLMSIGLVFTLGFLMLVSLVVSAALTALGDYLSGLFPGAGFLMSLLNWTISLLLISALFAAIYKILPDTPIAWRDVAVGSVATAILFTVGKSLIGLYIGSTSVASSYGAAGALLIIILWIYYSAQIFLIGAEYTRAYAETHGSHSPRESSARTPTYRRIEPRDSVR
jgi:membrane protein